MKNKLIISCATVLFLGLSVLPVHAETIYISVAASLTDAFKEITAEFAEQHPEDSIFPNFASSGSLAKQIEQGAPADLYVSANPKWMKYLLEKELIAKGLERVFAYNKLVFVGQKKTKVQKIADLLDLTRIAIGSPKSVPAGQYAKQAMDAAGIYIELEQGKKLVMAKDVRQALLYADRGEVDGAFVYKTDALLVISADILFTVPDDMYDRVSYPVGLTVAGAEKEAARAFYSFLAGERVLKILEKYGFEPAEVK